ncbi:hypothetical protein Drorol1_Dr00004799 [Drosera rotundifolia]
MPQNHFFLRIIISPPPPPCPLLLSSPPTNHHQRRRPNMSAAIAQFSVICRPTAAAAASPARCRICRCSIGADGAKSIRQWIGLKEARKKGARVAWVHNAAGDAAAAVAVSELGKGDEGSGGLDERRGRLSRRQRGSSSGGGGNGSALGGNADLLTVPGVGPRNLRKLVDNGITALAELKQLYKDKFLGESSNMMVEFLRRSVGIIHRNHAQSITTFIKESVDDELKEEDSSSGVKPQKKRLTFCVEGNISVGKTTFLQRIANETLELRDLVEVVPEPVDKWQDIGPNHSNILDKFYAEPERYAYTFQNYVFVTRVMQERESSSGVKALRLMERSVFSDRMVFVKAVHEAKWMSEMEISIYDSWFDPMVSALPGLIPDGFIYLRATPDTCHKRMMLRKRSEEGGVSLDYLRDLHEKHESWLFPSQSGNHGVLSVSKLPLSLDSSLHPDIRDRCFLLEGPNMHPSIQKVPALVLDCEMNIDLDRDVEAKQHYARQVAEFFSFVKRAKEVISPNKQNGKSSQQQVVLPQNPGLWVPSQMQFPDPAFKSLIEEPFRTSLAARDGVRF